MSDPVRNPISFWTHNTQVARFAAISESLKCDVCVIGAGITGLNCAYQLSKEGKSVVVLEDGLISGGETRRTTAHISTLVDSLYSQIIQWHGLEKSRQVFESLTRAIDEIERIVQNEKIECDFSRLEGCLFQSTGIDESALQKEYQACLDVGFSDIDYIKDFPLLNGASTSAVSFPNQAQFHILKYVNGMVDACKRQGVKFLCRTHVTEINDGHPATVQTHLGHTVKAGAIIVATNSPISDFVKVHTKQAPYRTYAVGLRVKAGAVPMALYWDTEDPYHYIRLQNLDDNLEEQILIVGGEDHRTGQADDACERFARLEKFARAFYPDAMDLQYSWSGQIYESVDGLSFIGRDPGHGDNIHIATGDSGMGMTHGTISGLLITDLIMGRENEWAHIYDPSRKVFNASFEYVKENVNSLSQYSSYLKPPVLTSVDELKEGEGGVIIRDGYHVAVYKDQDGILHEKSAYCPHMKGVVCFNGLEKTWDCPVHGARFTADGKVIDGPANFDLEDARQEFSVEYENKKRKAS